MTTPYDDDALADRIVRAVEADVPAGPCSCEELTDQVYEFIDAELGDAHRERLRRHVQTCETCRGEVDAAAHVKTILRRSCTEQAPESLRARIVSQLSVVSVTVERR
ncbi:mycothiol system anti-sigma-R factor [Georgenia sp. Z1344]|uniref:mycothiol system anti-sigma-R factor n=1 Tax=Georgenia sp. Z1344 TaxID=3416706 RepID=UPI003CE8E41D